MLAIHQPNYLPYTGYFHKMHQADTFVFLDSVQYPQGGSFANRNRIKTPQGVQWLTVPVHSGDTYLDTEFARDWKQKHLKTLRMNYAKAEYFDEVFLMLEEVMQYTGIWDHSFADLNINLVSIISNYLNIKTDFYRLSELDIDNNKNQMIIDLCKTFGADTYLSGDGARDYNDEALLNSHGIDLVYSDYEDTPYEQLWGDYEPNLSVVDRLFNCGEFDLAQIKR